VAAEYLRRALIPRLVVAASTLRWPQWLRSRLRQAAGRHGRVELYFAFDDPYSAVALPALAALFRRRPVELSLYPLLERGISNDPAAAQRLIHTLTDSRRLAARQGKVLSRTAPLRAEDTRFLAEWAESLRGTPAMNAFATGAIEQLWFNSSTHPAAEHYAALYQSLAGRLPPAESAPVNDRLAANSRRLLRKGHWESPAAWLEGEWFFAHERLDVIADRLDELGWVAA
jgi:2-hydroxychromene-2-carboxylate isomerase